MARALMHVVLSTLLLVGGSVRDVMPDMSDPPGRDLPDWYPLDKHDPQDTTATSSGRLQVDQQAEARDVPADEHVLSVIQRSAQQQHKDGAPKISQADVEHWCSNALEQFLPNKASFVAEGPVQQMSSGFLNGLTDAFKSLFNPKLLDDRYTIPLVGLGLSSAVNLDAVHHSFAAVLPGYAGSPGAAVAVWLTDPTHMPTGTYGTVPATFIVEREISMNFMEDHLKKAEEHSLTNALTLGTNVAVKIALKDGLSSASGVTEDEGWSFIVGYSIKPDKTSPAAIGVAVGFGIKERDDGSCCWIEDVALSAEAATSDGYTLALAHGKSWAWQADSPHPWLDFVTRLGGRVSHIDHDQVVLADEALLKETERRIGRRLFVMSPEDQANAYKEDDDARKDIGGHGFYNKLVWTLREAKEVALG